MHLPTIYLESQPYYDMKFMGIGLYTEPIFTRDILLNLVFAIYEMSSHVYAPSMLQPGLTQQTNVDGTQRTPNTRRVVPNKITADRYHSL